MVSDPGCEDAPLVPQSLYMLLTRFPRSSFAVLLLIIPFVFSAVAEGQTSQAAPPKAVTQPANPRPRSRYVYRKYNLDERVKQLAKNLDLDEQQQAGVKAALENQQLQARKIQFDQSLSGLERISLFRNLQEDTVLQIRALLNDEQREKYDPINHSTDQTNFSQPYIDEWLKHAPHK